MISFLSRTKWNTPKMIKSLSFLPFLVSVSVKCRRLWHHSTTHSIVFRFLSAVVLQLVHRIHHCLVRKILKLPYQSSPYHLRLMRFPFAKNLCGSPNFLLDLDHQNITASKARLLYLIDMYLD